MLSTDYHETPYTNSLAPICALLILGSRDQGHEILVIEYGILTITLTPCVKDISCTMYIQKPERVLLLVFFASLMSPPFVRN